jgi:VanZ family protein
MADKFAVKSVSQLRQIKQSRTIGSGLRVQSSTPISMSSQIQRYRFLRFICVALWVGLLTVGLWPFNFFPRNRVKWLGNRGGIHFSWHSQIYSTAPWKLREAQPSPTANDSFSIEIWLQPDKAYGGGTIFSIYDPARSENFRLDQSLTDLALRGNFEEQGHASSFRTVWIDEIFKNRSARFVTITSGPQGTAVYLDGVREHLYPYIPVARNFSGRLLVGHSGSGGGAWAGTLFALAIYDRTLTAEEVDRHYETWSENRVEDVASAQGIVAMYPFDERTGYLVRNHAGSMPDLVIPRRFYILHRRFLQDPLTLRRSDLTDALVNVLGFIPFGLLVSLYMSQEIRLPRSRAIVCTILLGGVTSFSIEFLQAYLPTRDSSYLDLINNILGTTLGTIVVERIPRVTQYFTRDANPLP